MTSGSIPADNESRHSQSWPVVQPSMSSMRAAVPLIRALVLATIVTVLIMIGLPTLLAAAAAASY